MPSDPSEERFDSADLTVPVIPQTPAEELAWIKLDKLIESKDPVYYRKVYNDRLQITTCDGKGPWSCEGYIGSPCDCN